MDVIFIGISLVEPMAQCGKAKNERSFPIARHEVEEHWKTPAQDFDGPQSCFRLFPLNLIPTCQQDQQMRKSDCVAITCQSRLDQNLQQLNQTRLIRRSDPA